MESDRIEKPWASEKILIRSVIGSFVESGPGSLGSRATPLTQIVCRIRSDLEETVSQWLDRLWNRAGFHASLQERFFFVKMTTYDHQCNDICRHFDNIIHSLYDRSSVCPQNAPLHVNNISKYTREDYLLTWFLATMAGCRRRWQRFRPLVYDGRPS